MTSSTAVPDLDGICRAALGRGVVASAPIGAGRNSRVFRVDLDGGDVTSVVVKFYRRDAGDPRDRLRTEFESLRFLWDHGVRGVPRTIAIDRDQQFAVYEYIDGDVPPCAAITLADVDESVDFLASLERLRSVPGSELLPAASEACFSLADIVASVERRRERLRPVQADSGDSARSMQTWLEDTFDRLLAEVKAWCRATADRSDIAFDASIGFAERTLSPSDFGFHNAIRRPDGTLIFVDFEYFGWDDPAKTIADYLLHPGMTLETALKHRFARRILPAFADVPRLGARARVVYPLFGLKWALILLNEFLPERAGQASGERRLEQLRKAQALTGRMASEYADNPYLS